MLNPVNLSNNNTSVYRLYSSLGTVTTEVYKDDRDGFGMALTIRDVLREPKSKTILWGTMLGFKLVKKSLYCKGTGEKSRGRAWLEAWFTSCSLGTAVHYCRLHYDKLFNVVIKYDLHKSWCSTFCPVKSLLASKERIFCGVFTTSSGGQNGCNITILSTSMLLIARYYSWFYILLICGIRAGLSTITHQWMLNNTLQPTPGKI